MSDEYDVSTEELIDDDEVSPEEEAFLRGYEEAANPDEDMYEEEESKEEELNIPFEESLEEE